MWLTVNDETRQKGSTIYHATYTCKMGNDQMAVVDDPLRVHGLERLRSSTPR